MGNFGKGAESSLSETLTVVGALIRLIATVVGLVVLILGILYIMKTFDLLYDAIRNPETIRMGIAQWKEFVGSEALFIKVGNIGVNASPIFILGIICLILAWLSIQITVAGAKIISFTAGDRSAVKELLQHLFGERLETEQIKLKQARQLKKKSREEAD